jgi:hypothetical protein
MAQFRARSAEGKLKAALRHAPALTPTYTVELPSYDSDEPVALSDDDANKELMVPSYNDAEEEAVLVLEPLP